MVHYPVRFHGADVCFTADGTVHYVARYVQ